MHKVSKCIFFSIALSLLAGCSGSNQTDRPEDSTAANQQETTNQGQSSSDSTDADQEQLNAETLAIKSKTYSIWNDYDLSVDIDGEGNIIHDLATQYRTVTDLFTDETLFYSASKIEAVKKDEWYEAIHHFMLLDKDGNPLSDWEEMRYPYAVGDWVVKQSYEDVMSDYDTIERYSSMINIKTGEEIEDVWYLTKIDENHAAAQDWDNNLVGIIDQQGNITARFPEELINDRTDVEIAGKYILLAQRDENWDNVTYTVFDVDLNVLGRISEPDRYKAYTSYETGDYLYMDKAIYDMSQADGGELTPCLKGNFLSFDGELAICEGKLDGKSGCYIRDVKTGDVISDVYQQIVSEEATYYLDKMPQPDFYYAFNGDDIYKLNRQGEVVAQNTFKGCAYMNVYTTGIICLNEEWSDCGLYDRDLQPLFENEKYRDISVIYEDPEHPEKSLWSGNYLLADNFYRSDLLRSDGTIIVEGASTIELSNDHLIPIIRGQNIGFMDLEGNWVYKYKKSDVVNMD